MHKLAKEIMDRVKTKINSCGIDGITEQELIEMKYWTCVADAMTSYDYHYKIIEEMEKPENKYGVNYDENGRFYTPPRMSNGQFRNDMRKHYNESYDMNPMHYRDMDMDRGRMYYTEGGMNGSGMDSHYGSNGNSSNRSYTEGDNPNGEGYYHESRYERARRGYEEAKAVNPNTEHMAKMEEVFKELDEEIKELKPKMTPAEKTTARSRLTNMANSMM